LSNDLHARIGKDSGNKKGATVVGSAIGKLALSKGIKKVAFDRNGFLYHGRVKALSDAARESGLEFWHNRAWIHWQMPKPIALFRMQKCNLWKLEKWHP
jgi:hypothetical protein